MYLLSIRHQVHIINIKNEPGHNKMHYITILNELYGCFIENIMKEVHPWVGTSIETSMDSSTRTHIHNISLAVISLLVAIRDIVMTNCGAQDKYNVLTILFLKLFVTLP